MKGCIKVLQSDKSSSSPFPLVSQSTQAAHGSGLCARYDALWRVGISRCLICRPCWRWRGCTAPVPSGAAPVCSWCPTPSWFWPFCSETRSWFGPRWAAVRWRGSVSAAPSGTGSTGTPPSAAAAAPPWRPCGAAYPPGSHCPSLVCAIGALNTHTHTSRKREREEERFA